MRAIFFIAISIILFLQSCAHRVGDDSSADNDSVFTVDYISRIAQLHPQEALSLLDSAERFEKMNVVDIDGLRAVVYNNALDMTDMSLIYARRVYDNPEVKTDTVSLLKSLMMLTALNLQESRYDEAIRYAGEGATVARRSNNRNALAYFLQMVGVARTETGSLDEGLDYLDDADKAAFDAVDRTIVEQKLYLQRGFSRDEAAQMSQMSPKHLSALFQQYADGFPNYINNLRLEHSVKLLRSKTKYTIEGISLECGFQSRQTFHRLFVERYGMTPAEFRRSATEK